MHYSQLPNHTFYLNSVVECFTNYVPSPRILRCCSLRYSVFTFILSLTTRCAVVSKMNFTTLHSQTFFACFTALTILAIAVVAHPSLCNYRLEHALKGAVNFDCAPVAAFTTLSVSCKGTANCELRNSACNRKLNRFTKVDICKFNSASAFGAELSIANEK